MSVDPLADIHRIGQPNRRRPTRGRLVNPPEIGDALLCFAAACRKRAVRIEDEITAVRGHNRKLIRKTAPLSAWTNDHRPNARQELSTRVRRYAEKRVSGRREKKWEAHRSIGRKPSRAIEATGSVAFSLPPSLRYWRPIRARWRTRPRRGQAC